MTLGIIAPTKSLPTGTPMISASKISTILGGIIWPKVPAVAIVPVAIFVG